MTRTAPARRLAVTRVSTPAAALGIALAILLVPAIPADAVPAPTSIPAATSLAASDEYAALAAEADRIENVTDEEFSRNSATLASRNALAATIARARTLAAAGVADAGERDAALTALTAAAGGLVWYSVLLESIDFEQARDLSGLTAGSRARLTDALAEARRFATAASDDPEAAITNEQVETAVSDLRRVFARAVEAPEDLTTLLGEAESWVAGSAVADYTAFSVRLTREAIAVAHEALDDGDPTTESLHAATEALQTAAQSRQERPASLRDAFSRYVELGTDRTGFSARSADALAIAHAAAVATDDSATADAATFSAAAAALVSAISGLVDIAPLAAAVSANQPSTLTGSAYTAASWERFTTAHAAAATLLAQARDRSGPPVTAQEVRASALALADSRSSLASAVCGASSAGVESTARGMAGSPLLGYTTFVPQTAPGPVPPAQQAYTPMAPGLQLSVLDGAIVVRNTGGSVSFAAGQFGYLPSLTAPPLLVPSSPALKFSLPPAFSPPFSTDCRPQSNSVDCIVRATVIDPLAASLAEAKTGADPTRSYCNASIASIASGRDVSASATTLGAAAGDPGYRFVSVLSPISPPNGQLSAAITLPADAVTGDLFLQYTYNGTYFETAVTVEVLGRAGAVGVTSPVPASTSPLARPAVDALARTGLDGGPLVTTALVLLLLGGILATRSRRRARNVV